jgi:glycosyltransferase involved in cell wall biosynthesis
MTTISVLICTYNRQQKITELVESLLPYGNEIVVVDSSDHPNIQLKEQQGVLYVRSMHKNQPYQRILGSLFATGDYLLYLDDDMELVDSTVFDQLYQIIATERATGYALSFKDKHADTTLNAVPKSIFNRLKAIQQFKNWFTGNPNLTAGKLGLCGNRGKQPSLFAPTEYLSGGAFLGQREHLFEQFNYQLLDLFEQRMGMGEDALIGYGLHQSGTLYHVPTQLFWHNDQKDSSYSMDIDSYAKRVLFSRLYLSMERNRLSGKSIFFAKLHYQWYALWRLSGLLINFLLKRNQASKSVLKGSFKGWKAACAFRFEAGGKIDDYWKMELAKNKEHGN